jgi:hypothetical protein
MIITLEQPHQQRHQAAFQEVLHTPRLLGSSCQQLQQVQGTRDVLLLDDTQNLL